MATIPVDLSREGVEPMCWSRYEDRWAIEEEREQEEEMRRLLAEAKEPVERAAAAQEPERELVET
jgi:hypothetical protein